MSDVIFEDDLPWALPPGDHRHGTRYGYTNWKCRCPICTDANRTYQNEANAKRRKAGLKPGDPRHGSMNAYANYGCRCDRCAATHSAKMRMYAERRRNAA